MKKGVIIGIIIAIVVIGMVSAYSISEKSNTNEITPSDITPKPTGVNHSVELSEGLTMTAPGP